MKSDNNNGNNKYPTWKKIALVSIMILIGGVSWFLTSTDARVKALEKDKLDKSVYYDDIKLIRDNLSEIKKDTKENFSEIKADLKEIRKLYRKP